MNRAAPLPRKRTKPRRRRPELFQPARAPRTSYASRKRDTAFMLWIKHQPCCATGMDPRLDTGSCDGPVEADHAGQRGLSHKADDSTCIPLCRRHHREPGLGSILYGQLARGELRQWKDARIAYYRRCWALEIRPAVRP